MAEDRIFARGFAWRRFEEPAAQQAKFELPIVVVRAPPQP